MNRFSKILIFGIAAVVVLATAIILLYFFTTPQKQTGHDFNSESLEEISDDTDTVFLPDITPLKNWYAHRMSDNTILLTRQQELPDVGATEGYAYGEQISINVVPTGESPETWVATHIDLKDVLVLESEWSTYYGQKLLTVEHEAGGASGKQYTRYLFVDGFVYRVSLFPLEIYDISSKTYDRNTLAVYDVDRVLFRLRPYMLEQESAQAQLAENCARDISQRSDDSSFDPENRTVTIWLWDEESQDSVALILPYEPETDFAGCSDSVKILFRHIKESQGKYEEDIKNGSL